MRYKYYFCELYKEPLKKYLMLHDIKHTIDVQSPSYTWIKIELYSTSENTDFYLHELKSLFNLDPIVFAEYTQTDLNNANYLRVSPKKQCIDIINTEQAYNFICVREIYEGETISYHVKQKEPFAIAKEPKVDTKTAFWYESTGLSEIFTDYRVKELVNKNSLTGVDMKKVLLRKKGYSEKIYQLTSTNVLNRDCFQLGHGEKKSVCPLCGKERYFIGSAYQIHLYASKLNVKSDLYVSEDMWDLGITYPVYIISQRFYQLLKQNDLAGGVNFSPVIEVET